MFFYLFIIAIIIIIFFIPDGRSKPKENLGNIINKKKGVYNDFFGNFDSFIKDNFHKNYDKILSFCEKKNTEFIIKPVISTNFYSMKVKIDYEKVIQKLKENNFLLT